MQFARYTAAMRWIMRAILLMMMTCLPACSAPFSTVADPLEVAPADFYVDATILVAPATRSPDDAKALHTGPAHVRPARYVLFADGTLRHGFDHAGERGANWLPPITRMLTRAKTAHANLVKANPGERVVFIDFRGNGRRWNFLRRAPLDQPPDAALAHFIDHLVQLSWADDESAPDALIAPKRYDFGPDPYERYRLPLQK